MISEKWHTNSEKEIADNVEITYLVEFTWVVSRRERANSKIQKG